MSAFDDEFGLFGEESEEPERRPTLGARNVASRDAGDAGIEPEVERPDARSSPRPQRAPRPERRPRERSAARDRDPWAGHRRASTLLGFLAGKLVAEKENVGVELFVDEHSQPVIELVVASDDLGKVIGRNGRVAHALRTLVRAAAEGRVAIDILDAQEAGEPLDEQPDAGR